MTTTHQAIARALATQRPLVIVVRSGDDAECWSSELAATPAVQTVLERDAVALDVELGTADFTNLAQVFAVPTSPGILVVANQQLVLKLDQPHTPDEFLAQWHSKVVPTQPDTVSPAASTVPVEPSVTHTNTEAMPTSRQQLSQPVQPAQRSQAAPAPTTARADIGDSAGRTSTGQPAGTSSTSGRIGSTAASASSETTQESFSIVSNPASSLAAQSGSTMTAERLERTNTSSKSLDSAASEESRPSATSTRRPVYRDAASESLASERDRIMRLVEADRREIASRKLSGSGTQAPNLTAQPSSTKSSREPGADPRPRAQSASSDSCSLAIRFLDSHQVKTNFKRTDTLKTVRTWIGTETETFDYLFTQAYPRRTFEAAEEEQTLQELGLFPSSNIILKLPPQSAARAYDQSSWVGWARSWFF